MNTWLFTPIQYITYGHTVCQEEECEVVDEGTDDKTYPRQEAAGYAQGPMSHGVPGTTHLPSLERHEDDRLTVKSSTSIVHYDITWFVALCIV